MEIFAFTADRPTPGPYRGSGGHGPIMSPETADFLRSLEGGCVRITTADHRAVHAARARFHAAAKSRGLKVRQVKDPQTGAVCFWAEKKA